MTKTFFKLLRGFIILILFYYIGVFLTKIFHLIFPASIIGLVLFTLALQLKIIKEDWVKLTVDLLLKNMAILFVPFLVGLIMYKNLLLKNILLIISIVFLSTTLIIILTGLFVENGIKFYRLFKMKGYKND